MSAKYNVTCHRRTEKGLSVRLPHAEWDSVGQVLETGGRRCFVNHEGETLYSEPIPRPPTAKFVQHSIYLTRLGIMMDVRLRTGKQAISPKSARDVADVVGRWYVLPRRSLN